MPDQLYHSQKKGIFSLLDMAPFRLAPVSSFLPQHHCRKCGKLVCGKCSEHRYELPNIGKERVCDDCFADLSGQPSRRYAIFYTRLLRELLLTRLLFSRKAIRDKMIGQSDSLSPPLHEMGVKKISFCCVLVSFFPLSDSQLLARRETLTGDRDTSNCTCPLPRHLILYFHSSIYLYAYVSHAVASPYPQGEATEL